MNRNHLLLPDEIEEYLNQHNMKAHKLDKPLREALSFLSRNGNFVKPDSLKEHKAYEALYMMGLAHRKGESYKAKSNQEMIDYYLTH